MKLLKIIRMSFIPNPDYCSLLKENASFHIKVREGKGSYLSPEYRALQRKLTDHEIKLSSTEIIQHAEYMFPKVGD